MIFQVNFDTPRGRGVPQRNAGTERGIGSEIMRLQAGTAQNRVPGDILSSGEFSRILAQERERADRSGQGFALVLFEVGEAGGRNGAGRVPVEHVVARRARAVDEIGWFREGILGAALAGATAPGARKFARDAVGCMPGEVTPPVCRIYAYPGDAPLPADVEWDAGTGGELREGAVPPEPGGDELPASQRAEGVESVFCRPMPRWKRCVDLGGAIVGLLVLSPVFLLIAAFIKCVSPGPVFYRQDRIGYRGRRFSFWKFRTMHPGNDDTVHKEHFRRLIAADSAMSKLDDAQDRRIIPFGNFLRCACVDELPQLINVLRGEMSLVGPRPCLPYEAEHYLRWHARRFDAVPGMTGLWQVSGKNSLSFKQMIRLDIRYSRNLSPWLDLKILFYTVPAILGMVSKLLATAFRPERAGGRFPAQGREVAIGDLPGARETVSPSGHLTGRSVVPYGPCRNAEEQSYRVAAQRTEGGQFGHSTDERG